MSNIESQGLKRQLRVSDLTRRDDADQLRRSVSSAILKGGPTTDPVASKLVKDSFTGLSSTNTNKSDDIKTFSPEYVSNAVWTSAGAAADAKNLLENLPDLELVIQILVSSIISPNDVMSNEILYGSNDDRLGSMTGKLVEVIREHFQDEYKLDDELPELIRRALATTGSYPKLVLPENSIDMVINSNSTVTVESLKPFYTNSGKLNSIGLLGGLEETGDRSNQYDFLRRISTEAHLAPLPPQPQSASALQLVKDQNTLMFDVTDNLDTLKLPSLEAKIRAHAIDQLYGKHGYSIEGYNRGIIDSMGRNRGDQPNDSTIDEIKKTVETLLPRRQFLTKNTVAIPTKTEMSRSAIGNPLTMVLPSEAVIPVVKPSDPSDHVGYFIVLDESGNPLRMPTDSRFFFNLEQRFGSQNDMARFLSQKVNKQTQGDDTANSPISFDDAVMVYKEVVENNLNKRLINGLIGPGNRVAENSDIYALMLARAYQHMQTQLVFVPKSLLTYFAYDYNDFGIGRSILEKSKMIGSLRSATLYSNVMTGMKNSITRRVIDITLDPKDPAPEKTVELLLHHAAYATRGETPFGHLDPTDIVSALQNSGIMTKVKGHPGYPEIEADVDFRQNGYTKVDTELDEMLKKWHHMMFGLSPETVELSMGPDLATSVISHNVFHAKRVKLLQYRTCEMLPHFIKAYTSNSGSLIAKLKVVVEENRDSLADPTIIDTFGTEGVVKYFIDTITTDLPEPDTAKFEMQLAALEGYKNALEAFLPSFISSDLFDAKDMGEQLDGRVENTVNVVKAYFLRRYMRVNNIMPELFDLIDKDDSGKEPLLDIMKEHAEHANAIRSSVGEYVKLAVPAALKSDKDLSNIGADKLADGESGFGGGSVGNEFGEPSTFDSETPGLGGTDTQFGNGYEDSAGGPNESIPGLQ